MNANHRHAGLLYVTRLMWHARFVCAALLAVWLAACATNTLPPRTTPQPPTLVPVATLFPTAAPLPTVQAAPDSGWLPGSNGIELRRVRLPADAGRPAASMLIVRLDPAAVRLRVGYAPAQPRPLQAWVAERQPLLAVNGGFFTPEYRATALVVSDGVANGASYEGFGGMLAVDANGGMSLRSLSAQPYQPGEPLQQVVQSFPMLVVDGKPTDLIEDNDRARRTVVAQDNAGRLLIVVCSTSSFTLPELAAWLAGSDLDIVQALNLDGGRSTGLFLHAGALQEQIEPFDVLPLVLLIDAAA